MQGGDYRKKKDREFVFVTTPPLLLEVHLSMSFLKTALLLNPVHLMTEMKIASPNV